MSLLLVLTGVIGQWLLGIGCAGLLLRARNRVRNRSIGAEEAGLGLVLGVAATAGLSFVYSLLGGSLGREWSLAVTALGWIWGGSVIVRLRRRGDADQDGSVAAAEGTFVRFCRTAIAVLFALGMLQTLLTPQRFWDERATFAIKASVLDLDGTVYSESLRHADFVQYHPQYPLLIPLAEQHIYALLGEIDDRWSKVVFPLLYLGLVLTFAGVLERHASPGRAWLFALLLATVPALMPYEYGFLCAQGDAPVACFHGVSLLYLWDAVRNRDAISQSRRSLAIAGMAAAAGAFTKDEGLALIVVDGVALLIAMNVAGRSRGAVAAGTGGALSNVCASGELAERKPLSRRGIGTDGGRRLTLDPLTPSLSPATTPVHEQNRSRGRGGEFFRQLLRCTHSSNRSGRGFRGTVVAVLIFAGAAAICLAPWLWRRGSLPMTTEMDYVGRATAERIGAQLETLSWSAPHVVRRMLFEFPWFDGVRIRPEWWGLQWWLAFAGLVMFPARALRGEQLLLILDVVGALAALLIAGMLSPTEVTEHIGGSSHRFLLQLAPASVLFAAGQWAERR